MTNLTEETFTYNINGVDYDYDISTPDLTNGEQYKNIMLSKDFGIKMGSHLDDSVSEYYCEVIQYTYLAYDVLSVSDRNGGTGRTENVNFTQLYTDMLPEGKAPSIGCDKANLPMTQLTANKLKTFGDPSSGNSRGNICQKQKTTFIVQNFNAKTHYFRIASLTSSNSYGFVPISSGVDKYGYGDSNYARTYAANLKRYGASEQSAFSYNRYYLKSFPHVMMYMTPIYNNRIARPLEESKSSMLTISSSERKSGTNGFYCVINIPQIASNYKRYMVQVQNLCISGRLALTEAPMDDGVTVSMIALNFMANGWNQSRYGYGGNSWLSDSNILTTIPSTYKSTLETSGKLEVTGGALFEINNIQQDIKFNYISSQMVVPLDEHYRSAVLNDEWEWILTLKLYGLN
tara:strand:+ start:1056 stop:2264 length:1209 start_codon:yes stop_codon:yes gene_type:complete